MVDGLSTRPLSRAPQGSARTRRPRLLVSVRDADEAIAALDGGADIIDIKEPRRGPLGMADPEVIAAIVAAVDGRAPVSAALGELREWTAGEKMAVRAEDLATALAGLSFVKLGLAGCSAQPDWVERWVDLRTSIDATVGRELPWVAVAYADARRAVAPPVDDVIRAAVETSCRGVLIDTCDKRSGSLVERCSPTDLARSADACRSAGLFLALAGRLSAAEIDRPELRCADILGVRSAACTAGDREQCIRAEHVAALKRSISDSRKEFSSPRAPGP